MLENRSNFSLRAYLCCSTSSLCLKMSINLLKVILSSLFFCWYIYHFACKIKKLRASVFFPFLIVPRITFCSLNSKFVFVIFVIQVTLGLIECVPRNCAAFYPPLPVAFCDCHHIPLSIVHSKFHDYVSLVCPEH